MVEDRKFHHEISRAAHTHLLFNVFAGVNLMMKETHWKAMKSKGLHDPANVAAYAVEHAAILAAILARDVKAAAGEARTHLSMLKSTLF